MLLKTKKCFLCFLPLTFVLLQYLHINNNNNPHLNPAKPVVQSANNIRSHFVFEDGSKDAVWQLVNGTKYKFYVYSAYLEDEDRFREPFVRIIAAAKTANKESFACEFHFSNGETSKVKANVKAIKENFNLQYSATFVTCPLNKANGTIPESVSVVTANDFFAAANRLRILNAAERVNKELEEKNEIGICVKPIYSNYPRRTVDMLEFIELSKILGVSHFTFYNSRATNETLCALKPYLAEGIVELLDWDFNFESKVEIRTEGIFAALNDCLYRNVRI